MNKNLLTGLAFIAIIAVIGGVAVLGKDKGESNQSSGSDMASMTEASPSSMTEAPPNTVIASDFKFQQPSLKVKKGTMVTWKNEDSSQHTVTSDNNGPLKSPRFGKGQTYQYAFNEAGNFSYFCEPHPYMKGTVEVTE